MIPVSELRDVDAADVYKGDLVAGSLTRVGNDVVFRYHSDYLDSASAPDLAWSIPKSSLATRASGGGVPAFFAGLLPEGVRLTGVVTATKTSEDDHFTLLLAVGSGMFGCFQVVKRCRCRAMHSIRGTVFQIFVASLIPCPQVSR